MDESVARVVKKYYDLFYLLESKRDQITFLITTLQQLIDHYSESMIIWGNKVQDLNTEITEVRSNNKDLEDKLKNAQKLMYNEKQKVTTLLKERKALMHQLNSVRDILREEKFHKDTQEKLSFLSQPVDYYGGDKLDAILELDSTDFMMSELSYTLDEDESTTSNKTSSPRRSRRPKKVPCRFPLDESEDVSRPKKSRSKQSTTSIVGDFNEEVVATTTITVPRSGPVCAKSIIEAKPSTSRALSYLEEQYLPSAPPITLLGSDSESGGAGPNPKRMLPLACHTNTRLHDWVQKSQIMGDTCSICPKKIKFSSLAFKCSNCKAVAHICCKDKAPLPCVPIAPNTPRHKNSKAGNISEYVPAIPPFIPSLVVHCIREIEARGFNEVGLYRVPGSDREVKSLKDKLIKAKGLIDLSGIPDIHVICGCLKEFIRTLKEPIIPHHKWEDLQKAAGKKDFDGKKEKLYQIVNSLPQANRDTLAYIILHLQRVSASANCKMPVSNLSKMFGPSIIGCSTNTHENLLMEINLCNKIMADLILLPCEFWEELLDPSNDENQNPAVAKTPSQYSLNAFSNSSSSIKTVRKFRFFDTP